MKLKQVCALTLVVFILPACAGMVVAPPGSVLVDQSQVLVSPTVQMFPTIGETQEVSGPPATVQPEATPTIFGETPQVFVMDITQTIAPPVPTTTNSVVLAEGQASEPAEGGESVDEMCRKIGNSLPWGETMFTPGQTEFFGTLSADERTNQLVYTIADVVGKDYPLIQNMISIGANPGVGNVDIIILDRVSPINEQTIAASIYEILRTLLPGKLAEMGVDSTNILILAYLGEQIVDAIAFDVTAREVIVEPDGEAECN